MRPLFPYCLSVHPGENLADIRTAIDRHTLAVKAHVAPEASYPVGLRLSASAAEELAGKTELEAFAGFLARRDLFVTGINGFPYGAFHNTTVKASVYAPDWATRERLNYTGRLATILAALLPEGETGNLSTVPLGYKKSGWPPSEPSVYVRTLSVLAEFLHQLHQETNREIVLALEPEPDCLLENTNEAIAWFEDQFLFEGSRWLSRNNRRTRDEAETLLRKHVGLCLDTCHFAVAFEDPLTALIRFESACIRVARVQLSAAVRITVSEESLHRLTAFIDPVYLHQTKILLPRGEIISLPDLSVDTLKAAGQREGCELRTHFHIPLFFADDGVLGSTRTDLTPDFFAHVQEQKYPLEIETYTFDVLPPALRSASVVDSLIREYEWIGKTAGWNDGRSTGN